MARVHGAEMKRRSSHELSGLDAAFKPEKSEFVQYHMSLMERGATGPEVLSPHGQLEAAMFKPSITPLENCFLALK